MYVWYLPEFLLMMAEEDVVNKKTRRLIQEQDIETYHCSLCNKPSVQDVVGCDNCTGWYHLKCLCQTKEPKSKTWFCGYCDS